MSPIVVSWAWAVAAGWVTSPAVKQQMVQQEDRVRGVKGGLGWSDIDCLGAWRTGGLEDSPFNKIIFEATF